MENKTIINIIKISFKKASGKRINMKLCTLLSAQWPKRKAWLGPFYPRWRGPKPAKMGPRPMCTHCASTCSPHTRSRSPVFSCASGPVAETGPRPAQARGAPASQATTWAWAGHSASTQSPLGPKAAREALGRRWPSDRI